MGDQHGISRNNELPIPCTEEKNGTVNKPQSHRLVRFLDRTIGCDWAKVRPIGNVCYDLQHRSHTAIDLYRRGRVITNDWRISMARAIVGNRATSGSDQRPMYDQLLRPATDRIRAIVESCMWSIVRPIVTSCDRAYTINRGTRRPIVRSMVRCNDQSHDQSQHRATDRCDLRPVVRSIVAPNDRSYDQSYTSCDRSYDQSCDYRSAIIHNWWCHHARLVVRSRIDISATAYDLESQVRSFEHDLQPCYDWFCPGDHPRHLRPVVRSFYDVPTIPNLFGRRYRS